MKVSAAFIFILPTSSLSLAFGAGDEIRTRDPQLGRLMLYQLSYTRPSTIADFGFGIAESRSIQIRNSKSEIRPNSPGAGGRIRTCVRR